jgi:hypothetical protein
MNILRNEKGFALAIVLVLAAIALVLTLGMLFLVGQGSFVSGQQMRYRTAVEAGKGGAGAMLQLISSRGNITTPYTNQVVPDPVTLGTKLTQRTSAWGGGVDNSITINPTDNTSYDMRVDLGAYRVYTKIVDAVEGNSGGDEGLLKTAVVNSGSGEVVVMSIPYLYTIEVLSQSPSNPVERSKLSALYQY